MKDHSNYSHVPFNLNSSPCISVERNTFPAPIVFKKTQQISGFLVLALTAVEIRGAAVFNPGLIKVSQAF